MTDAIMDIKAGAGEVSRRVPIRKATLYKGISVCAWGLATYGAFKGQSLLGVRNPAGAVLLGTSALLGSLTAGIALKRQASAFCANATGAGVAAAGCLLLGIGVYRPVNHLLNHFLGPAKPASIEQSATPVVHPAASGLVMTARL